MNPLNIDSEHERKNEYDKKYSSSSLNAPSYFRQQFRYILKNYASGVFQSRQNLRILDLGGGTGEYAAQIKEMGLDVTVFDYSKEACKKAEKKGLKTIHGDFYNYQFETDYDLILVKGFSPLNTDDLNEFMHRYNKIRSIAKKGGTIIYWTVTDLSGQWTESGWFYFMLKQFTIILPNAIFTIFPFFRLQAYFPAIINNKISKFLLKKKMYRPMIFIAAEHVK